MSKNNSKELKKLVKNFRFNELRAVLTFAKRSYSGKKSELFSRVTDLIDNNLTTSVAIKIKNIHKFRLGYVSSTSSSGSNFEDSEADSCKSSEDNKLIQIKKTKSSKKSKPMKSLNAPVDVKFTSLAFYDMVSELVKPTAIKKSTEILQQNNFAKYEFSLTPQQVRRIQEMQSVSDDCILEYNMQVLLRFFLMDSNAEQDDNFPNNLSVSVNGKPISLPPYNTPSHTGIVPKRPGRPLDITFACNLTNVVDLTWNNDLNQNFCFNVSLAIHLTCDQLIKRLKTNPPEVTKKMIEEKLAGNADFEISFTSLKISLLCPLSKMRITLPIRSSNCNHLQCFDAPTYLIMNNKKPTWICPICDKPARYETLSVDGLFVEILNKVKETNEIQFFEDGSWKLISEKKVIPQPNNTVVVNIPDSPTSKNAFQEFFDEKPASKRIKISNEDSDPFPPNIETSVIDLTEDTDEEDNSPPEDPRARREDEDDLALLSEGNAEFCEALSSSSSIIPFDSYNYPSRDSNPTLQPDKITDINPHLTPPFPLHIHPCYMPFM